MTQMQLAQVLDTAANHSSGNIDKLYYYSNMAEEAVNKSIESSPGRVPIYFIKAQIYLTRGDKEKAIETLKYAVSLNEDYYESTCQLARIYLAYGDNEEGFREMDKCIDKGGLGLFRSASLLKNLINHYVEERNLEKIIKLHERLVALEPNNAIVWVNLAKLYAQSGEIKKAIKAVNRAVELDQSLMPAAEEFIDILTGK